MKHKTSYCLVLIFVIILSVFSVTVHIINAANTTPVLSVVFSGTTSQATIPSQGVGTTFNVDIRVDNIPVLTNGVNGYTYNVSWDPTVLALENINDPAAFLGSSSFGKYVTSIDINSTNHYILVNDVILDTSKATAGVSASSGVLSTLTFAVLSNGGSSINLQPSGVGLAYLSTTDSSGNSQDVQATAVSATYGSPVSTPTPTPSPTPTPTPTSSSSPTPTSSPSPTPTPTPSSSTYGPTAVISINNGTTYAFGSMVVLDGSSSTGGYDNQSCPITNFAWLVQYANGTALAAYSGPNVSFAANVTTYLNVTLIVTAKDTAALPSPSYVNTSYATVWINIQQMPHAQIDLFTNKGGIGPNVSSDAYGPQELVLMYANVTYNYASVADKEVTFTVLSPNGTTVAVQVASTNTTGIASASYRTPWLDNTNFGTWTIIASVDISQVVVTDMTNFTYNYLITTNGITIPSSVHRQSSMTVTVNIQSIENSTLWTTATITLYDEQNVPIDSYVAKNTNETAGPGSFSTTFTIPSWAFVGTATAYVNILTNNPATGGVAYCPEKTANFQILA